MAALEAAVEDGPSSSSLEAPYSQQHQQCSSEDPAAAATTVEAPFAVEAEAANSKKKAVGCSLSYARKKTAIFLLHG